MDDKKKLIEATLFVAAKPVSLAELYQVLKIPKPKIRQIISEMIEHYDGRGVKIIESDGLYEMRVHTDFEGSVSHLAPHRDFSKAILQTLSLIAYKNPVKQSNIISVRGNRAYDHLRELEGKGFIRREAAGHTNRILITRKFLDYFGLESAAELKEYFGPTAVDKILTDVEVKEKVVTVEKDVIAIDPRDLSFSEDGNLPEKLRLIVEKKKEEILKRRKKTVSSEEDSVSNKENISEDDDEKTEEEEIVKDDTPKKFKSSFEDVID